jgi:hypothetical protein
MSHGTPIAFVVDDDVSVRESLELLIRCEGWQPEIFASAQEFLTLWCAKTRRGSTRFKRRKAFAAASHYPGKPAFSAPIQRFIR